MGTVRQYDYEAIAKYLREHPVCSLEAAAQALGGNREAIKAIARKLGIRKEWVDTRREN